jgi:ABC-type lipoprotein export system ATPase subunit
MIHPGPQVPAASSRHSGLPVVVANGVTRTYRPTGSPVTAVQDATWVLEQGMQVALTGPSGSGKSTLLYLIAAFDTPTSGTISWPALVKDMYGHPQHVGVVFQGASLIATLDVNENIALPLLFAGVGESEAGRRAARAAAQLSIADVATKLPQELSGGQAQRVAIARAVAAEPALILADEPTGKLDQHSAAAVIDVLLHASTRTGAALVVATHDPRVADRLRHRWTMCDGRLDTGAGPTGPPA